MEVTSGVAELQVDVDRPAPARYGLNVADVQEAIETLAGGRHPRPRDNLPGKYSAPYSRTNERPRHGSWKPRQAGPG